MIKRRIKNLGRLEVLGQLLFIAFTRLLAKTSQSRLAELYSLYGFKTDDIAIKDIYEVESANSDEARLKLSELAPDVVVINGTRILSQQTLEAVEAPFINTHAGITPRYRGVHGGYWALALNDKENCGVTVHLVDKGIDTGEVIGQAAIHPEPSDFFLTYPIHQLGAAKPLLLKAIQQAANKSLETGPGIGPSNLFYHPTIWGYLKNYFLHGVK